MILSDFSDHSFSSIQKLKALMYAYRLFRDMNLKASEI